MNAFQIINNWIVVNCNDYWEKDNGIIIDSMADPGWRFVLDIDETCLQGLEVKYENDCLDEKKWYKIYTKDEQLIILCSIYSVDMALMYFNDEIVRKESNSDFIYKVYVPFLHESTQIGWLPLDAILIDINTIKIIDIPSLDIKDLKLISLEMNIMLSDVKLDREDYLGYWGKCYGFTLEKIYDNSSILCIGSG